MALTQVRTNSSDRLVAFLDEHNLHKKDFAEMIGVTLSYVYSLISAEIPFSTRSTTIERIAIVMDVPVDSFPEYKNSDDPRILDPAVQFLQRQQRQLEMTTVQLLKRFPRSQRVDIVDMWRGALPIPLDWNQLMALGEVLQVSPQALYPFWEARLQQTLIGAGMEPVSNAGLMQTMSSAIKQYIQI
jgi:transcriptional regulator with XRE-family HTH domain